MIELTLDVDEGIILESDYVTWVDNERMDVERLTLTNKNLYITFKKNIGLFKKGPEEVSQRSLSNIKVFNGQPLVELVKNEDYNACLQIQFLQGREKFAFDESPEEAINWVNAIWQILVGTEAPIEQKASPSKNRVNLGSIGSGLGSFAANIKSAADTAMQSVTSTAKQVAGQANASYEATKEQIRTNKIIKGQETAAFQQAFTPTIQSQQTQRAMGSFCVNCGTQLNPESKFCPSCGSPVGMVASSVKVLPIPTSVPTNQETRQQEYAGMVLKCPNCGAVISQTTAVCPECGHYITGQAAVSSIQAFSDRLMLLESRRKRAGFGQFFSNAVDPVDNQKLSLIRSFPIPNTIADIQEFMLLAIANIDVALSKNTWSNRNFSSSEVSASTIAKTISDAWVAKMKQAYQKAVVSFPNESAFAYIKQLYTEKMTELKMKIEE